ARIFGWDDAADDHRHIVETGLAHARDHVLHQRHVRAREDRQADHVHAFLQRRIDDLGRREAYPLVHDLHAGIARAHRDLLGAVGVAVEAGLADQELDAPAELARHALDVGAHAVEPARIVARRAADAGRRAVFAERVAQRRAPFAGGDAGLGGGDRGGHDVAPFRGGGAQVLQRGRNGLCVARGAPGLQALDLFGFDVMRDGQDRAFAGRKRRDFGLDELVDADDDLLAALDQLQPPRVRLDELRLHVARLDRRDRAAHLVDTGKLLPRLALELFDPGGNLRGAVEDVAIFEQVGLVGEDLLHAQRPLLVERARQAERLVPGG